MDHKSFKYDELPPDTFRLLRIINEESIHCVLKTFSFKDPPPYTALSYVWSQKPQEVACYKAEDVPLLPVQCTNDANGTSGPIKVSPNLIAALTSLKGFAATDLWMDALCIDQTDNKAEKNQQVRMMHQIYTAATQVIVWLGNSQANSDLAMDVLFWLASPSLQETETSAWPSALKRRTENISSMVPLESTHLHALLKTLNDGEKLDLRQQEYKRRGLPDFYDPLWQAFVTLYFMPWFSRLWTFEEVMLAQACLVVCGGKAVAWTAFYKFGMALAHTELLYHPDLEFPERRQPDGTSPFTRLRAFMYPVDSDRAYFFLYVREGRFKEVSKKVDRIYALQALASKVVRDAIDVDYNKYDKSDRYHEVYIAVSLVMMKHYTLQSVLADVPSVDRQKELPSWCPDYDTPPETLFYGSFGHAGYGRSRFFRTDPKLPNTIFVGGTGVDVISEIVSGFEWQWPQKDFRPIFGPDGLAAKIVSWLDRCWTLTIRVHARESEAGQAYWQALLGNVPNSNPDDFPHHPARGLRALKMRLEEHMQSVARHDSVLLEGDWAKVQQVMSHMGKLWRNKVFFSTTQGRLGYASRYAKEGDQICVFFGEAFPHVLRQRSKQHHSYVSVATVQGLMLGEGMQALGDDDANIFTIF